MSITDRLIGFVKEKRHSAIVLSGGWGEGKTYFWKDFAKKHAKAGKEHRHNYAYVSLFGINSLADLRNAIAENLRSVDNIEKLTFLELLNSDAKHSYQAIKRGAGKAIRATAGVNVSGSESHVSIGNIAPVYMAWAYHSVRNALICLDDIERRSKDLALKDVMGLIADLVNERNCSVVAILNDGSLQGEDRTIWDENREKVFLGELRWKSDCDRSIGYVYENGGVGIGQTIAIDAIKELGIKNVRIIQRIKLASDQIIHKLPKDLLHETLIHVVRALTMITYVRSGQGAGAPPLDMLRRKRKAVEDGDKYTSEQIESWHNLLQQYSYYIDGTMDEILDKSVEDGYSDFQELVDAVDALNHANLNDRNQLAMQDAWDLYQGAVGDNAAEVVDEMSRAFKDAATKLSATNADSAICLVRDLGEEKIADEMIAEWIEPRAEARWKEFGPKERQTFGRLSDVRFNEALDKAYSEALSTHAPQFKELMDDVADGARLTDEVIFRLSVAPVDDFYCYFSKRGFRKVGPFQNITMVGTEGDEKGRGKIYDKIMIAWSTIAQQSKIDRRRVAEIVAVDINEFLSKHPAVTHLLNKSNAPGITEK